MSNDTSHKNDQPADERSPEELTAARQRALTGILKYATKNKLRTDEQFFENGRLKQIVTALDKEDPHCDARQALNTILVVCGVHNKHAPFKHGKEALDEIQRALTPEVDIATYADLREVLPFEILVEHAPYIAWGILAEAQTPEDSEENFIAFIYTSVLEEKLATMNGLFNGLGHKEILEGLGSAALADLAKAVLTKCLAGSSFSTGDLSNIVTLDLFANCATVRDHWKRVLTPLVADPNGWLEEEVLVAEPEVVPPEEPRGDAFASDDGEAVADDDLEEVDEGEGTAGPKA